MVPEPVLDGRAMRRQLDAPRRLVARKQLDRREQDVAAAVELAERAERGGERDMDVDEALVGCGQQLQRRLEPAGGGGRSARGAGRPGGEQHRDGRLVTPARVLLDVMGALGRGGAARGEGCCGPRVGREPPARRCCLVDRTSHEWMAKGELTRNRCRADEIDEEQCVERAERLAGGISPIAPARPGSNGSPATAAARSSCSSAAGRDASSSASAAATAAGTGTPATSTLAAFPSIAVRRPSSRERFSCSR